MRHSLVYMQVHTAGEVLDMIQSAAASWQLIWSCDADDEPGHPSGIQVLVEGMEMWGMPNVLKKAIRILHSAALPLDLQQM